MPATLAADPRFSARQRQPGLDLLRAFAIALVVFYHAGLFGFRLPYDADRFGWIGVDLFFVLSGYLIAGQLVRSIATRGSFSLRRFFWRRSLRILPAYLVVVAIYLFLPSLREYPTMPPAWKFLTFVQNINLHGGTAFSHAWSLCVEAQFYLLLPFLLLGVARWRGSGLGLVLGVVIGGMVTRGVIAYFGLDNGTVPFRYFQPWIYYATWSRLDPLTFGVALAAIEVLRPRWWRRLMQSATWIWLPAFAAIAAGLYLGEGETTLVLCLFQFPLIALGLAALLVCAVSSKLPFQRLEVPGAAFGASIAYSVYLSHKLVIHAFKEAATKQCLPPNSFTAIALVILAIVAGGSFLFFLVERPFLQLRQRRS